mmetsp:Transcript_1280/g.2059  ORF Transcript_1280/g.2059 Transcript_1280/m.2059 type:complete len:96 (+) Transcript_1280:534-821(+)
MYLGDDAANTTGHHISEEEMELAIRGLIRVQSPVPRTEKEKTESLSQELDEQDVCLNITDDEECENMAKDGQCLSNPEEMLSKCRKSCSVCFRHG